MTLQRFQSPGNTPVSRDLLNNLVNETVISPGISLRNLAERPSGPIAFFLSRAHNKKYTLDVETVENLKLGSQSDPEGTKAEAGLWSSVTATLLKKSLIVSEERAVANTESCC